MALRNREITGERVWEFHGVLGCDVSINNHFSRLEVNYENGDKDAGKRTKRRK